MKETEILRGLDKARAKRAQAVQKFADGVVQAQPRPSPMSLRGLAQAIGNGFETMSTGAANLAERVIPIRPRPMPTAAPAPMPVPAAPVPAPAAVTPGLGAIGEYSGGMQGVLQRREAAAGLRSGVAQLEGPGTETSDDIPAWLSKGEAVLPAKTVQAVGPKNIARLIADTNGKPPVDGIKHGLRAASGAIPGMEVREVPIMDDVRNPNVGPKGSVEAQAWRQAQTAVPTQPAPAVAAAEAAPKPASSGLRRVVDTAKDAFSNLRGNGTPKPAAPAGGPSLSTSLVKGNLAVSGAYGVGSAALSTPEERLANTGFENPAASMAADALQKAGNAATVGLAGNTGRFISSGMRSTEFTAPEYDAMGNPLPTPGAGSDTATWDDGASLPAPYAPNPAPKPGLSAATGAADNRDPYAAANAAKLAAPLQLPKGAMDPETGLMEGVVDRSGNSFAGQNITAGPTDANPGMGGNAGSRAADARASAIYRQIIDEGAREGDAARASATATNDALERSFNNEQNQREIRRGLSQARYEAGKLYGRSKAAALDSILKAEQEAAQAPEKLDIERSKANGLNGDAKARMMQSWLQHQDNLGERRADREQRASDAAAQRALTAATAQRQAQKDAAEADSRNYEASGKEFDRLFDDTDAKGAPRRREDLEALATLTAQRNSGGKWRTMSTADRAKAREDAVETVKFISAARDGQNNEWLQALGLKQPDAVLDYLPQLKGRKLEKAGIWEGASTPNASIGDYVIRMPNGKDMYLPYSKVTEGTLAFLKKQGVDIGGLKNGG